MLCSFSNLDESAIKSIQALESEIGKSLISFSCHDVKAAALDDAVLDKIKKLEKELSVSLVAIDA
ncbi:MAG: hypothetical protein MI802_07665 [Desulfobacterales bacterium]|nr:hypothetical protein [Desulfobacterales bacterium]